MIISLDFVSLELNLVDFMIKQLNKKLREKTLKEVKAYV